MQIETQSYQLPQYHSTLLKKQRQSKHLSPKVTQVHPQIKQTQNFKIKKHHLDDTEVRQALQYEYNETQQPSQYVFKGERLQYNKNNYGSFGNSSPKFNNKSFLRSSDGQLKMNSEYFESQKDFRTQMKPQKDVSQDSNQSNHNNRRNYQTLNPQPRLKKSISTSDFQSLRKNQAQMQTKVIQKLNSLETENGQIITYLKSKQKSSHPQPVQSRYRSEAKCAEIQKDLRKLKERLQKQRSKQKQRLSTELRKIKQESKKIKQEQKKRKKSFKQFVDRQTNQATVKQVYQNTIKNNRYLQNLHAIGGTQQPNSLRTISSGNNLAQRIQSEQQDNLIRFKISQLQTKYLPKTNVVNKRIQCQIYDPHEQKMNKLKMKPQFQFNDLSDTDSQFSDY